MLFKVPTKDELRIQTQKLKGEVNNDSLPFNTSNPFKKKQ